MNQSVLAFYLYLRKKEGNITKVVASTFRSSHRRCSVKKGVPENFAKFTGRHLCQSLFFNKVAGLRGLLLSLLHCCMLKFLLMGKIKGAVTDKIISHK